MSQRNIYTGRYAPSPTGELHLGNLRTALAAWLYARSNNAPFFMRIDDLDPDRVKPSYVDMQLNDLRLIGIDWDGEPIYQSSRLARYEQLLDQLQRSDHTYPCFCSRADIRLAVSAPHDNEATHAYPGTCSHLPEDEVSTRIANGEPYCLRVRADKVSIQVDDLLFGTKNFLVDDFVVRRKDNVPAYLLTTTIDDHDLEIGTVVRGRDLLASAARQIWLSNVLGLNTPYFAHVPLVVNKHNDRLAKRDGAATLKQLASLGFSAQQVRMNLLASLRVNPKGRIKKFDLRELPTSDEQIHIS